MSDIISIFAKNLIKGAIFMGICLTILEIIPKTNNSIGFYAAMSASFFYVNLMQYYYVSKLENNKEHTFLYHSLMGNILWMLYALTMIILYKLKFTNIENILITFILTVIVSIIYYINIDKLTKLVQNM
tara:strand:+ start:1827 stop:2213 length:387 start_codon:yes stop_codon:yes gene_type:complete